MSLTAVEPQARTAGPALSWRWVHVGVAALAMTATLPGRTQGLGLFTEPILRTFRLGREDYALVNLWATLLGGLFCLPCGWLMDRLGTRRVLAGIMVCLAFSVFGLGAWTGGVAGVAAFILLTRGFGQSALSVGSLTLIGRSAKVRTGLTMGVYSCLVTVGFVGAFGVLREVVKAAPDDWRGQWNGIGIGVLVAAGVTALLVRHRALDADHGELEGTEASLSLGDALKSRAFWAFALGTSFYGLVVAGTSLFNESILAERGYPKEVFLNFVVLGIPVGLAANLFGGWMATRVRLNRLFAVASVVVAATLFCYPLLREEWHAYLYAAALAAGGGVITVCFFTVWRKHYGPASLGRIQGAAQLLTVLFSAVGPALFAATQERTGAYAPLFPGLGLATLGLAAFSWFARPPALSTGTAT